MPYCKSPHDVGDHEECYEETGVWAWGPNGQLRPSHDPHAQTTRPEEPALLSNCLSPRPPFSPFSPIACDATEYSLRK
jgi:hypothetical protein